MDNNKTVSEDKKCDKTDSEIDGTNDKNDIKTPQKTTENSEEQYTNTINFTEEIKQNKINKNNEPHCKFEVIYDENDIIPGQKEYEYVQDFTLTEDIISNAKEIVDANKDFSVEKMQHLEEQKRSWEKFYKFNKTNFFKDRHYLTDEFFELKEDQRKKITLLDAGCGVGNSFYILIRRVPNLHVYAFDFSQRAVNMAKTHPIYEQEKHRINLTSLDLVNDDIPYEPCDYGILMFVLSAIKPEYHVKVVKKLYHKLKEGAILYFRDYCRYDLTQLRFAQRGTNKVGDNLYMRKDNTLSYYFDKLDAEKLFKENGFKIVESNLICRQIENRKEKKVMQRLWLQMKLRRE